MRFGVRRLQKTEGKWQLLQLLQSDCETVGERERKKEREMEESDYDQWRAAETLCNQWRRSVQLTGARLLRLLPVIEQLVLRQSTSFWKQLWLSEHVIVVFTRRQTEAFFTESCFNLILFFSFQLPVFAVDCCRPSVSLTVFYCFKAIDDFKSSQPEHTSKCIDTFKCARR